MPSHYTNIEEAAAKRERERIAEQLMAEADGSPCSEDADVLRSAAWLVRADFSYEEAERLEIAAEQSNPRLTAAYRRR